MKDGGGSSWLVKAFAAATVGVGMAMLFDAGPFLLWFAALGRPGHVLKAESTLRDQIQNSDAAKGKSPAEIDSLAKSQYVWQENYARVVQRPIEFLIITSAVFFSAWFASIYARGHDQGEKKPVGSIWPNTLAGTLVGAAVMWTMIHFLIHEPEHALAYRHASVAEVLADPKLAEAAEHFAQLPPSTQHWYEWLVANETLVHLIFYVTSTVVAALVAVWLPWRNPDVVADVYHLEPVAAGAGHHH